MSEVWGRWRRGAAIAQLIEVLGRGEGERNQRKAVRGQEDRCFTVIRELPSRLTAPGGEADIPNTFLSGPSPLEFQTFSQP